MGCGDIGAFTGDVDNDCLKDIDFKNQLSVKLSNLLKPIDKSKRYILIIKLFFNQQIIYEAI